MATATSTAEIQSTTTSLARKPLTVAKKRQYRAAYLFVLPFFIVFITMLVVPLVYAGYLQPLQEQAHRRRLASPGFANYVRALTDPDFLAGVGRMALFLIIQVPIMLGPVAVLRPRARQRPVRGSKALRLLIFLPYAVPGVVATLMWGYLYGQDFGPIAQIVRALGFGAPDFLLARNIARLDDEHRHVGVRRLQHDHHVRGAAVDPRRALRGGRDRRRQPVRAWRGASRSPPSGRRSC